MANEHEIKIKITGQDEASPSLTAAIDKLTQSVNVLSQAQLAGSSTSKKAAESHSELKVGLINLTATYHLVKEAAEIVGHVFHAVEKQVERAIEEALEFEKANNRLAGALVASGKYTAELSHELDEHIESLEKSAGAHGELAKNMIATGIQMGLSVEKSKEMEEAARKLAAATGKDVNEAFTLLRGSLTGQSRALAAVLPQVRQFGEAQLKQGAAIGLVSTALEAQYKLYQQSLPAAIDRANISINSVYKAFGLIITQSEVSKMAVNAFTAAMVSLEHGIKAVDKWLTDNKQTLIEVGGALLKVVEIGAVLVAGYAIWQAAIVAFNIYLAAQTLGLTAAGAAASLFGAAMSLVLSPITLTIAAVTALTFAFYKWPGLFDVLIGSFKTLIGVALVPFTAALGGITVGIGAAARALGLEWGASLENAGKKLIQMNLDLVQGGIEQAKYGVASVAAGKEVQKAHSDSAEAAKKELEEQSKLNAAVLAKGKLYAGINYGTDAQRAALAAEVGERETDLKNFTDYLDAKKRIAISKKEEEQMELARIQTAALTGTGGSTEGEAKANAAVDAEIKKQAELDVLFNKGILTKEQYHAASLASDQRAAQAELDFMLANKEQKAALLGDSPEGYEAKRALDEERWKLELQTKMQRAEEEGATDAERKAIQLQAEQEHEASVNETREQNIEKDIKRNEKLHNNWGVTLGKIKLEQEKHGKVMGAIKGVQATQEFQGAQKALGDLSSLRNSHSKKAFEVGKAAATAQAVVNTFTAATGAYSAMAAIPIVGPALGAVAAAAAVAAGIVNIQKIQSQKFSGGQADEGMDAVPGSLAGKSFILSQGERVVQPSANRDLKDFLSKEKSGGSSSSNYNITLNYGGAGSREDASKMADMVIQEIRARSERGTPVMSERGLTKA